jgi:hypothetical protein
MPVPPPHPHQVLAQEGEKEKGDGQGKVTMGLKKVVGGMEGERKGRG